MNFVWMILQDEDERNGNRSCTFLPPVSVFMLGFIEDPSELLVDSKDNIYQRIVDNEKNMKRSFVFLPINNAESPYGGGGTHWSLLVMEGGNGKRERIFYHFDSFKGMNSKTALLISKQIGKLFSIDEKKSKKKDIFMDYSDVTPQQQNGYDCGLFAIAISEILVKELHENEHYILDKVSVVGSLKIIDSAHVQEQRSKILFKVIDLSKQKT